MRTLIQPLMICLLASAGLAQEFAPNGDLVFTLENALWRQDKPDQRAALTVTLTREAGRWSPWVVGYARNYNQSDHHGRITSIAENGTTLTFSLNLRVEPDPYTGGTALATYDVSLDRGGGRVQGKWTGKVYGQEAQGNIAGTFYAATRADRAMPEPGEHPRLLIRKADLPALRRKAQTPWGRGMMERLKKATDQKSGMAVAQGLLYALTGEQEYADRARELIADEPRAWYTASGIVHDGPARAVHTALAFDLVYDTCDEAFRKRLVEQFILFLPFFYSGGDQGQFNQNDHSNWSAMFRSGVGMAALVTLDEPWLDVPKPVAPQIAKLTPPADLKIGKDVPVVRLDRGSSWGDWLVAGPFRTGPVGPVPNPNWTASPMLLPMRAMPLDDALAPIGGEANARPENGTAVGDCVFAPLDTKHLITKDAAERVKNPQSAGSIDMASATKHQPLTTTCFYSVIDIPQSGFFRVELPTRKVIPLIYIAGQRLGNGEVVHLDKGRYPVLARVGLSLVGNWMKCEFSLRLLPITNDEAGAWLRSRTDLYQADMADWQFWQAHKPARGSIWSRHYLAMARQRVANYANRSMGDSGWNTEGEAYTQHSLRLMLPFAHSYRNVTGRELAPVGHLNSFVAGYLGRTIAGQQVRMQSYGCGGGPLGVDNIARGFGLFDEALKPSALWLWNLTQAAADAGRLKDPVGPIDQLDAVSAAFMFIDYPLEMQQRAPADSRSRITIDHRKGGYVFRNRWQDDDDLVAQIFANTEFAPGTWNTSETGDLRISGLGVDWLVRGAGYGHTGSSRKAAHPRLYSNTVLPAEPLIKTPMEAAVTFEDRQPDGSGVISLNMGNVYSGEEPGPNGGAKVAPVRPGARVGYDLGLGGMRSFAADYSGKCGSPALFAVADRITGSSGRNTWQLITEKDHKVTIEKSGFTIAAANGATLHGTVIAPAGAKIEAAEQTLSHEINYHGKHVNYNFPRTVITFSGSDHFFVVMTIQKGAFPAVQVAGDGAAATARIGDRSVSFDGVKIILGTK